MHAFGTVTLLLGMLLTVVASLYVTAMTFKVSLLKGMLCFLIPGYAFFIAKRNGFYGKFFTAYVAGVLGMIVGGAILS
jgi:hypothetical protein